MVTTSYPIEASSNFTAPHDYSKILPGQEIPYSATMAKISWCWSEVTCCVANCSKPGFQPQMSNIISPSLTTPLSPSTPISACSPPPPSRSGGSSFFSSRPCCEQTHKHFFYSVALPPVLSPSPPSPKLTPPSPPLSIPSPPLSMPSPTPTSRPVSPPDRPRFRARRDTLSKLKVPSSPPYFKASPAPPRNPSPGVHPDPFLQMPTLSPRFGGVSSTLSSALTGYTPLFNRELLAVSPGPGLYPDMLLPIPSPRHVGGSSATVGALAGYTPLFNRALLAMSPISPY